MATVVTRTVGPSSMSPDYTSLAAWEAGTEGDLVTADEIREAECYAFTDTTPVNVTGSTVNADCFRRIVAAPGNEAQIPIDFDRYVLEHTSSSPQLAIDEGWVEVHNIQVAVPLGSGWNNTGIRTAGAGVRLLNGVVVRGAGELAGTSAMRCLEFYDPAIVINCVAYSGKTGHGGDNRQGFRIRATCTFYNCTAIDAGTDGFMQQIGSPLYINCRSLDHPTGADFAGGYDAASSNNLSSDGTAPGNDSIINSGVTGLLLGSGDNAIDVGADLSADPTFPFNYDIFGTSRPQGVAWDIGAHELEQGDPDPEPITVSLSPAVAQWSASALTSAAGPVARAISPAPGSWAAQALTPAAGALTRDLTPAEGRWLASAPAVLPGPVTRELTPAAASWHAQALSVLTDDLVVQLTPATAQWQASALQLLAGAVTRELTPAEASWTAQALATLTGTTVQLQPAVAQWLAGAPETELGARAVVLSPASAAWQASELAILREGISIAITAAVAEWEARALEALIGGRTVQLVPAVASWEASVLEALTGDVQVALVPAVGQWEASVLVAIGGLTDARIIVLTSAGRSFLVTSEPRDFRLASHR